MSAAAAHPTDKRTKSSISCRRKSIENLGSSSDSFIKLAKRPSPHLEVVCAPQQQRLRGTPTGECPALLRAPDPARLEHHTPLSRSTLSTATRASCCTCLLPVVQQGPVTSHVPPSFSFPSSYKVLPSSLPQNPSQESSPPCSALSLQCSIMSPPKGFLPTPPYHGPQTHINSNT